MLVERPTVIHGLKRKVSDIDGLEHEVIREHQLNANAARLFSAGDGRDFLDYLHGLTTNRTCGPKTSDAELRHWEGARWLVGVIQQRVHAGQQQGRIKHVPEYPSEPSLVP